MGPAQFSFEKIWLVMRKRRKKSPPAPYLELVVTQKESVNALKVGSTAHETGVDRPRYLPAQSIHRFFLPFPARLTHGLFIQNQLQLALALNKTYMVSRAIYTREYTK